MSLEGGRTLTWERSFSSEARSQSQPRLLEQAGGCHRRRARLPLLVRPYSVATDSRGRIIVTDPGAEGVHIFDFRRSTSTSSSSAWTRSQDDAHPAMRGRRRPGQHLRHRFRSRRDLCLRAQRKVLRAIGSLKGGEGYFKRPTGIAVDSAAQRIYVTDTLRDQVFILDMQGNVLKTIGKTGDAEGEFNLPTELAARWPEPDGRRRHELPRAGLTATETSSTPSANSATGPGAIFRPKGLGVDSEGDVYIVDALWGVVQVFNQQGQSALLLRCARHACRRVPVAVGPVH
jgi:hypothetical protein